MNHPNPATPPKLTAAISIRRGNPEDHQLGWDHNHPYLETFWLPVIGPSSTALIRYINRHVPDTNYVTFTPNELASALGLGQYRGRNSPIMRTINRISRYRLAQIDLDTTEQLAITAVPAIPVVPPRHRKNWSEELRILHTRTITRQRITTAVPATVRRSAS